MSKYARAVTATALCMSWNLELEHAEIAGLCKVCEHTSGTTVEVPFCGWKVKRYFL